MKKILLIATVLSFSVCSFAQDGGAPADGAAVDGAADGAKAPVAKAAPAKAKGLFDGIGRIKGANVYEVEISTRRSHYHDDASTKRCNEKLDDALSAIASLNGTVVNVDNCDKSGDNTTATVRFIK